MATNASRKKTNSTESSDSPLDVIKETTCPSNTGKSTLGYQIGSGEKGDVHFKLTSNSGGGHFSSSWISFKDVQAALKAWPQDQPVTSMAFRQIAAIKNRSANNAGFACAVLVAEGFLEKIPGKSRVHSAIDPKLFKAKVEALQVGGGIPAKKPARKPKAKSPAKVKTATKAKTNPKAKAKSSRKSPATKRKAK